MLQELSIKDFAIIDRLNLQFTSGLTVLSGETGAGKSIIVGALGLLMGNRASGDVIRTSTDEAVVEAVFDIQDYPDVSGLLESWGIDMDESMLIIRRIISRSGKNRIYIGDRVATSQMLSQLGGRLIDISGQYSQQLLLHVENHIDIIDAYGGLIDMREEYTDTFKEFGDKVQELNRLVKDADAREQKRELMEFQCGEIEKAGLVPGEDDELDREKNILENAQQLYQKTYTTFAALYEDDDSCLSILNRFKRDIDDAATIDDKLISIGNNFEKALLDIEDIAFSLRDYAEKIQINPERLLEVEARLDEIYRLKRKYGSSIEDILAFYGDIGSELASMTGDTKRIDELRGELSELSAELWKRAEVLSSKRKKAAARLKKQVERELETIGMQKAVFSAEMTTSKKIETEAPDRAIEGLNNLGKDTVEFYIATNQGEDLKPLSKVASGGEISRIVLALKKILAEHYRVPTLLFDEVDAGIGGAVAESVGHKLKEISESHQVFCITHLAQIACFAEHQYTVQKQARNGRTTTQVELLNEKGRVDEISRMLGGKSISDKTRAHAREMLKNAHAN